MSEDDDMAAKDDEAAEADVADEAKGGEPSGGAGDDDGGADEEGAGDDAEGLTEAAEGAAGEASGDDAEDEPVDYVELVKIHNVRDPNEAHLVRGILESFSIPCSTEDGAMDNFGGMLPTQLDGVDIFVPARYEQKAKAVLCERNIVCGIEEGRLEALVADATDAVASDPERRASLLAKIAEETRDYRHEALSRIGKRGKPGFELLRLLLRGALRSESTAPVSLDVAALTNQGAFGSEQALLVLDDLDHLRADPDAAVRKRCATALGRLRGVGAAPALVDLLGDGDAAVRDEALESLYALSGGETFDFDPELTPVTQEHAIAKWRAWARDNAAA